MPPPDPVAGAADNKAKMKATRPCPGVFEELAAGIQRLMMVDVFDGLRFEFAKGISQNFSLSHTMFLGTSLVPTGRMYNLSSTYVHSPTQHMLNGRIDPSSGIVSGTAVCALADNATLKIISRMTPEGSQAPSTATGELRYMGKDFTLHGKGSVGPQNGMSMSYLQSITQGVCVGGEARWNPAKALLGVSVGLRASSDVESAALQLNSDQGGPLAVTCGYLRQIDPQCMIAVNLDMVPEKMAAVATYSYAYRLTTSSVCGSLDTRWKIMTTIEERISPAFGILFSGMLDHANGKYSFGFGLTMGQ